METKKKTAEDKLDPIKVTLPFGQVNVGSFNVDDEEVIDDQNSEPQNWLIYSSSVASLSKLNIVAVLIFMMIVADLIIVVIMYINSLRSAQEYNAIAVTDSACLATTILSLSVATYAILRRSETMLVVFFCIYAVDATINLICLSTVLQFVHFIMQIILCHLISRVVSNMQSTWFYATYIPEP